MTDKGDRFVHPKARADDRRGSERDEAGRQAAFEPTEAERAAVKEWGRFMTQRQIAVLFSQQFRPISQATVGRHFADELEWARANMISGIGGVMVDKALGGDVNAAFKLLEMFGDKGQFVRQVQLTGPGGGPVQVVDVAALTDLDDQELQALERASSILAGRLAGGDTGETEAVPSSA